MKTENENKKTMIRLSEGAVTDESKSMLDKEQNKAEKFKKPVIFLLMGIVFFGCMYLIFKPSGNPENPKSMGLNDAVPQATGAGLPDDKSKAYEQEILESKNQENKRALTTLSDYWNMEKTAEIASNTVEKNQDLASDGGRMTSQTTNPSLNSYRNMQDNLRTFYQDNSSETVALRRQLEDLKEQLAAKDIPKPVTVDDQLSLMEKSYQLAAKYLPSGTNMSGQKNSLHNANEMPAVTIAPKSLNQKESFVGFTCVKKNTVSALYREPSDSLFLASWDTQRNIGFNRSGSSKQDAKQRNSIKACIHESQVVVGDASVRLRLLEDAKTPSRLIPKGTVITASSKLQGGRLQLKISSLEFEGNIIPVDITVYDLDGQPGLYVYNSFEINAMTEMAGNMSQTSGASVMLMQSAGQQVATDLTRGVVQGISGYFAKKIQTPKVELKEGHQVFLVSKQ